MISDHNLAAKSATNGFAASWLFAIRCLAGAAATLTLVSCQSAQGVNDAIDPIYTGEFEHIQGATSACFISGSADLMSVSAACASAPGLETGVAPTLVREPRPLQHVARFPDALPREDLSAITLVDRKPSRLVYQATDKAIPEPGALAAPLAPRAAAALSAGEPIEVAFYCSVCSPEDNAQPRADIVLSANQAETNSIEFSFTPDSRLSYPLALPTGSKADAAIITLVLYKDGVRYDQISVPLELLPHQAAMSRVNLLEAQLRLPAASQPIGAPAPVRLDTRKKDTETYTQASDAKPDITLLLDLVRITAGERRFRVEATIRPPTNPAERRQFQEQFASRGITIGDGPEVIHFDTRFTTFSEIDDLLRGTYEALSCLTIASTEQTAAFRTELRNRHLDRCEAPVQTRTVWSDSNADADRAANALYKEGRRIFRNLFGDPENSKLAQFLIAARAISDERAAGRLRGGPLKIRYHALEYHIPLQLVHPPVDAFDRKAPQFFGLSFNIVAGKGAAGETDQPFIAPFSRRQRWNVAYAGYTPSLSTTFSQTSNCGLIQDVAALQSCEHYKALAQKLTEGGTSLSLSPPMFESGTFTGELKSRSRELSLVWAFAHGLTRFDSASGTVAMRTFRDARLILSANTPPFYPSLIDSAIADPDPEVFKKHPLVVLLACETGVAGSGGTSGLSFPQAFINAGAIGVVATESEVNGPTANIFGAALLESLFLDRSPSEAVLFARRKIFSSENGNLWPLLFHYTGSQSRFREN